MLGREFSIPAFTLSHTNVFCLSDFHLEGYKNTRDAAKLKGPARIRVLTKMVGCTFKSKAVKRVMFVLLS
jgi:hypothetical protein